MSSESTKLKWQEANEATLNQTDIKAAYESLGVRFSSRPPTAQGWLECHAIDRDDDKPSAAVNVSTGPKRGRYRDLGGDGESLNLWEFASKYGTHSDWRAARQHFASQAGVDLPKGSETSSLDQVQLSEGRGVSDLLCYSRNKPGVTFEGLKLCGARAGAWPKNVSTPNAVLAVPSFGPRGIDSDPTAYHLVGNRGQPIVVRRKGKSDQLTKTRQLGPGGNLFGRHAIANWREAKVVWLVEGASDLLALQSTLGDRTDHVVVTVGGCTTRIKEEWRSKFAGKEVRIVYDHDRPDKQGKTPGQKGAAERAAELTPHAAEVRNILLPMAGQDLRDYLGECSYADLCELAEQTKPVESKTEAGALLESLGDGIFTNGIMIGEGKESSVTPISLQAIIDRLKESTGNWPRRISKMLFCEHGPGDISYLDSQGSLFAYLHLKFPAKVKWHRGDELLTKGEFCEGLRMTCTDYETLEVYPHLPDPRPQSYYSHPEIPSGADGAHLDRLLDFFNPETDIDRDLLKAAVMTIFWGGECGERPVFLFTAESAQGAGKTTTASALADLVGGAFQFSADDKAADMKKRLLTPEARGKRVALVDNVKASKFSWADFESMVTATHVSGHQMFHGEGVRPNMLTWFITMNSPSTGDDIADRAFVIKLAKPRKDGIRRWRKTVREYAQEHAWQIIADVKALFDEPAEMLGRHSRWESWEADIGCKMPDPIELMEVIKERQAEINGDRHDGVDFADFVCGQLEDLNYDTQADRVFISVQRMAKWYQEWSGDRRITNQGIGMKLSRQISKGQMNGFARHRTQFDKGFLLQKMAEPSKHPVHQDLEERIRISF